MSHTIIRCENYLDKHADMLQMINTNRNEQMNYYDC